MQPKISVIVPCYSQAHFLPEALASVQAQMFQDWECIIVNDGSPDDTAHVAAEWVKRDVRFRYIEKPNGGLSSARNAGLRHASGDYVHFLDSDDFMLPGAYAAFLEGFQRHPQAAVVYCGHRVVNKDGKLVATIPPPPETSDPFHRLLRENTWPPHCVLARRAAVSAAGLFDTGLRSCEDWDFWLRIAATGAAFVPVRGEYACYRRYENTMSRNAWRMLETGFAVIERYRHTHTGCPECRIAGAHGQRRWREIWWNSLYLEVHELLMAGRLGSYTCWVARMAAVDVSLTWRAIRMVSNHKRAVVRALFWSRASDKVSASGRPLAGGNPP